MDNERTATQKFIRVCIMIAALSGTAYAEWTLAVALHWNIWIACGVPAALDLYVIDACNRNRDVAPAVLALVAVSAASYTYAQPLDPVATPLRIAVASIAPLILWRLHVKPKAKSAVKPEPAPAQPVFADFPAVVSAGYLGALADKAPEEPVAAPETPAEPTEAPVVPEPPKQPSAAPVRLSDAEARKIAEYAWMNSESPRKVAPSCTRSHGTVYKWFKEFDKDPTMNKAPAAP